EVSLTNASPEEVAKQVDQAGGGSFEPGKWEVTISTLSVDIPGLDPAMQKQMGDTMLKQQQTHTSCMTKKQAKSPPAEMIARSQGHCKYENFQMDNGRIDGTLVCAPQGTAGEMRMRITGSFDSTNFAIENDMEATAPNGPVMKIKGKSTGKRIGDCTAEEERKAEAEAAGTA